MGFNTGRGTQGFSTTGSRNERDDENSVGCSPENVEG